MTGEDLLHASTPMMEIITRPPNAYLGLCPELQLAVLSYIRRPSDLKAFCLACRELRLYAVERLYRTVKIDPEKYTVRELRDMFHAGNPGIHMVRKLNCSNEENWLFRANDRTMHRVRTLLRLLPRHRLQGISLPCRTDCGFDEATWKCLFVRQYNLQSLNFLDEFHCDNSKSMTRPFYKTLTSLKLASYSVEVYESFAYLLQECTSLKEVLIPDFSFLFSDEAYSARNALKRIESLIVLCHAPIEASRTFRHLGRPPPLLDHTNLVSLSLEQIESPREILQSFTAEYFRRQPVLQHFRIDGYGGRFRDVAKFLCAFSGLQTLYIDNIFDDEPEDSMDGLLDGIIQHASTLRQLYIGPGQWRGTVEDPPWHEANAFSIDVGQLSSLCSMAVNLRQIALCMPDINMRDAQEGTWGEFGGFLRELSKMPQLVMLSILTYPLPDPDLFLTALEYGADSLDEEGSLDGLDEGTVWNDFATDYSETQLPALLDLFGTQVLQYFQHSMASSVGSCPLIAIGSRIGDRRYEPGTSKWVSYKPRAYYPTWRTDHNGGRKLHATAQPAELVKYDTSECDVLEFGLHKCIETVDP